MQIEDFVEAFTRDLRQRRENLKEQLVVSPESTERANQIRGAVMEIDAQLDNIQDWAERHHIDLFSEEAA